MNKLCALLLPKEKLQEFIKPKKEKVKASPSVVKPTQCALLTKRKKSV